jgi:Skp family chaperone for outer membrane proteins
MGTVCGKIRIKTLLFFFVVLVSSFWAAGGFAGDDPEEAASRAVLARLQLSTEVQAKVNAIFAEYKGQIEARGKAIDEAYGKAIDAAFAKATNKGSEDAVKTAKEKWDEETRLYTTTIHERDAKIKKALPPELAATFARGMQLITERNAKFQAVTKEAFAKMKKALQAGKQITEEEQKKLEDEVQKKDEAIDKEYNEKLDAEVGKLNEQK